MENTLPPIEPQHTLPHVRGEDAHGQRELVHPGPRRALHNHGQAGDGDGDVDDETLELFAGVAPGASWRRHSAGGDPVPWEQLDLQLSGIHARRGRVDVDEDTGEVRTIWAEGLAAPATMEDVRAQTFDATDLGGLDALSLPAWARRRWELTANEERLLGWLWRAYERRTGGVFECQCTLAADLGFSERTMRHILNGRGGKYPRIGLVERGLVRAIPTHRAGTEGRPTDDGWLILRIGPEVERLALPQIFARGPRPPRRSGWTRRAARAAAGAARREARQLRSELASKAWKARRRRDSAAAETSEHESASTGPAPGEGTLPLADDPGGITPRSGAGGVAALGASAPAPATSPASAGVSTTTAGGPSTAAGERSALNHGGKLCLQPRRRRGARYTRPLPPERLVGERGALRPPTPAGERGSSLRSPAAVDGPPAVVVDTPADAGDVAGAGALAPRAATPPAPATRPRPGESPPTGGVDLPPKPEQWGTLDVDARRYPDLPPLASWALERVELACSSAELGVRTYDVRNRSSGSSTARAEALAMLERSIGELRDGALREQLGRLLTGAAGTEPGSGPPDPRSRRGAR